MNCWIRTISYARSTGYLRTLYDRVKGPDNNVDNVMKAHSLRPHTMEGHSGLYRSVLHHTENSLPGWLLEALGVYTSMTNKCNYSVTHHFVGLSRLLGDQERADAMYKALAAGRPENVFAGKELALFRYVRKLTKSPYELVETDIEVLREAGAEDGEILEANQVCAYFNYSNRLLNGLGVTTEGDSIGLSPPASADLDDWRHG